MVSRGRDRVVAIRRYRYGINQVRMAFERAHQLGGLQIPHLHRLISRSRDGAAPVGRYC